MAEGALGLGVLAVVHVHPAEHLVVDDVVGVGAVVLEGGLEGALEVALFDPGEGEAEGGGGREEDAALFDGHHLGDALAALVAHRGDELRRLGDDGDPVVEEAVAEVDVGVERGDLLDALDLLHGLVAMGEGLGVLFAAHLVDGGDAEHPGHEEGLPAVGARALEAGLELGAGLAVGDLVLAVEAEVEVLQHHGLPDEHHADGADGAAAVGLVEGGPVVLGGLVVAAEDEREALLAAEDHGGLDAEPLRGGVDDGGVLAALEGGQGGLELGVGRGDDGGERGGGRALGRVGDGVVEVRRA
ncbi:MAG: hypothetical protein ACK56F_11190, partial [bacterium]